MLSGCVYIIGKVLDRAVVGNDTSLGELIHNFSDFNEDISICVEKLMEILLLDNDVRVATEMYVYVFKYLCRHVEVKIIYVYSNEHRT